MNNGLFDLRSIFKDMLPPDQQMRKMEQDEIAKASNPMAAMAGSSLARLKQRLPARAFQLTGDRGMLSGQQNMVREMRDIRPDDPDIFNKTLEAAKKYMPEKIPDIMAAEETRRQQQVKEANERQELLLKTRQVAIQNAQLLQTTHNGGGVQTTKAYPNGTVMLILRNGSRVVMAPDGSELTGKDAEEAIKGAREEEINQSVERVRQQGMEEQRAEIYGNTLDLAYDSVSGLAESYRILDLLKTVETGGWDERLKMRAKRMLGIENEDEGELYNMMGTAVISRLRQVFGAQFTEKEGKKLEEYSAGWGTNNRTNAITIGSLIQRAEANTKRAIAMARTYGQEDIASTLEEQMAFRLNPEALPQVQEVLNANPQGDEGEIRVAYEKATNKPVKVIKIGDEWVRYEENQ